MFYARIRATKEVLGGAWSSIQDAEFLERYASALGITDTIEMFESDADPRGANSKVEAPPEKVPAAPTIEDIIAVLSVDTKGLLDARLSSK